MLQDLAALAPPVIVGLAFLIGVGALLRRELAPRRRGARGPAPRHGDEAARGRGGASQT